MTKINENYLQLQGNYLFATISQKREAFMRQNPDAKIISLGIGDVTKPLAEAVISSLHQAVDEMGIEKTFHGYGPDQGYDFLVRKIIENDYNLRGVSLDPAEVFISDGSKCDIGNIQEIFSQDSIIAVTDPVYPVYVDSNVMAGRAGEYNKDTNQYERIVYLPCYAENGFIPALPNQKVDLIYLCYPNNPTGMTLSKAELKKWVDFARKNSCVILYDAAYEAYIQEQDIPHSIYEVEGAREVAIEFRSFSKTAGFTGTRCAYTVVPKELYAQDHSGHNISLHALWNRRQATKFNGVSYITQQGAAAIYTSEGKQQTKSIVDYYMNNAHIIREGLTKLGLSVYGGINAPYIWLKTPNGLKSWEFFDKLLKETHIVGTPGAGFGQSGEGYFRLTAFGSYENTLVAMERFQTRLKL